LSFVGSDEEFGAAPAAASKRRLLTHARLRAGFAGVYYWPASAINTF
jgi:hypothetical protein